MGRCSAADARTHPLLHLVKEYARHLGQLDIVAELANGHTGEMNSTAAQPAQGSGRTSSSS